MAGRDPRSELEIGNLELFGEAPGGKGARKVRCQVFDGGGSHSREEEPDTHGPEELKTYSKILSGFFLSHFI